MAKRYSKNRAAAARTRAAGTVTTTSQMQQGRLRVYTDGACSGNGFRGAVAGWGVFFPDGEFANMYGPLQGVPQTNQRAELTAIVMALRAALTSMAPAVVLYTDSQYSIKCLTVWIRGWVKNGWRNSKGEPVANSDLIQDASNLLAQLGKRMTLHHVRGHVNDPNNDEADRLARLGASGRAQQDIIDLSLNEIP
ncbi:ribonuclease H [Gregarina niphandrodes]|uniref:ribonuclease H n=1 Tax=Gregarina niphandrodes TaxID=110365 RepID=A0A023B3G0_GRENI|nr:ribonuclease H [Gregarina niphandrodes]EZG55473.1 ribonuclease H [Gregarina niphandrodes]|eukprot:XP_011131542.1 ribonuclease H [Gregarina niphandrodes]